MSKKVSSRILNRSAQTYARHYNCIKQHCSPTKDQFAFNDFVYISVYCIDSSFLSNSQRKTHQKLCNQTTDHQSFLAFSHAIKVTNDIKSTDFRFEPIFTVDLHQFHANYRNAEYF